MVLAELRDLVRAEANIQGLKEYSTMIDASINQELSRLTGKSKYEELRAQQIYTTTGIAQNTFLLPVDYQHIISATYNAFNSNQTCQLGKGNATMLEVVKCGWPYYYARQGLNLIVYPYMDVAVGDILTLDYYKKVILTLDADSFPVPSLELPVIQFVIARMLSMTDTRKAQFAAEKAEETYRDTRAENAGN